MSNFSEFYLKCQAAWAERTMLVPWGFFILILPFLSPNDLAYYDYENVNVPSEQSLNTTEGILVVDSRPSRFIQPLRIAEPGDIPENMFMPSEFPVYGCDVSPHFRCKMSNGEYLDKFSGHKVRIKWTTFGKPTTVRNPRTMAVIELDGKVAYSHDEFRRDFEYQKEYMHHGLRKSFVVLMLMLVISVMNLTFKRSARDKAN